MVDFFKSLFQNMFKGKKVSRNYQRCLDEFADKLFGGEGNLKALV